ncbi:MAG: transcription termination factor Rho [Chthoniobacteraceae bacterium]
MNDTNENAALESAPEAEAAATPRKTAKPRAPRKTAEARAEAPKTTRTRKTKAAAEPQPELLEAPVAEVVNAPTAPVVEAVAAPAEEAPTSAPKAKVSRTRPPKAKPAAPAAEEVDVAKVVAEAVKPIADDTWSPSRSAAARFEPAIATPEMVAAAKSAAEEAMLAVAKIGANARHAAKPVEKPAPAASEAAPAPVAPASAPVSERPSYPMRETIVVTPQAPAPAPEPVFAEGIVEVSGKGFGFLRDPKRSFVQSPQDVFVTPEVVRRFNLRDGQWIRGEIRRGSRGPQLFRLVEINGDEADATRTLPVFDELTVISPNKRIRLETTPDRYTTRIMDMMTPLGKGQRGLIVAPPRTGKTTLLQHIADAVVKNHPEMKLIILLIDERPEEVTEIKRTVPTAEIMASSNDSDIKSHTRIAQLAVERAKRMVEAGKDVFVLLDSITRVGRAFNNAMGGGGRTMSGGIDARALEIPRKLFAAARNTEEAGSLTIVATALIETGSRMDELIFQEFKGTGNMELVLDRKISDLRIYPAVDIFKSGTRREELLLPADQLHKINVIRRGLAGHKPEEAIERLLTFVRRFPTNEQMLREIPG